MKKYFDRDEKQKSLRLYAISTAMMRKQYRCRRADKAASAPAYMAQLPQETTRNREVPGMKNLAA